MEDDSQTYRNRPVYGRGIKSARRSNGKALTVELTRQLDSQQPSSVWAGKLGVHQVVLKTYNPTQFDKLANELGVHKRLVALRPKVIARIDLTGAAHGRFGEGGPRYRGPSYVYFSEPCSTVDLHRAGIEHCDIAPRNVLIRPRTCVADFGNAPLNNHCEGWNCPELVQPRRELEDD
ncbi:hypothetical protein DFH09DRAFT_1470140 [Mycena vulgaris]|nr:hypothetical protein DFH09DRAFT_1470140 [Mycena vulgaris]